MQHHRTDITAATRAIALRHRLTPSELTLWNKLRRGQLGARFRRQEPIGPYIADFVSLEHKVIVEADGDQHEISDYDERRDAYLRSAGFEVLRFRNEEVASHLDWVVEEIRKALQDSGGS